MISKPMALTKFWLVNGSKTAKKKKAVKSKKVYKPKKTAKRKSVKTTDIFASATPKRSVRRSTSVKRLNPNTKAMMEEMRALALADAQAIRSLLPDISQQAEKNIYDFKPNKKGVYTMAKKRKSTKRKVAKKVTKAASKPKKYVVKKTKKNRHKIVVYKRGNDIMTSRKSKIARKNLKVNALSMASAKGTLNQLKPALITGGISVASMIALNKGMEHIPYIKNLTGWTKSAAKVGLGLGGMMLAKKFVRNNTIAGGILLGAVISALIDVVATRSTTAVTTATSGIKISGAPLAYGTPSTTLGTPQYKGLGALKLGAGANLKAIKMPVNSMNGNQPERW